ncbi:MAG: DUF5343 domain-containing protein [Nitrospirae bacterium]|nr:DUF5343 domain-containing protein [Nitrospirota bacterium]
MSDPEKEKKAIPPYVSYKTFHSFLDRLKIGIPSRIDRSLMGTMSGAAQSQLTGALRFLNLISPNGLPTDILTKLIHSEGVEKQETLKEIVKKSYSFLFGDMLDLKRVTPSHLQESFMKAGATGATNHKCISFFISITKEAGIAISPHIKAKKARSTMPKVKRKVINIKPSINNEVEQPIQTEQIGWQQLLLSKFPSFDPAWSAEVQTKWFEGFNELMKQVKKQSEEE